MALVKVWCGVGSLLLFVTGLYVGNDYIAVWKALLVRGFQVAVKQDMVCYAQRHTVGSSGLGGECSDLARL
jgi:hypothetical protein